ncbi:MAG TPA: holo-ACP synthase [Thermoanaerobacter sp.]|nr:holo-ACP synthase [Thermoanaerobacter sp.]
MLIGIDILEPKKIEILLFKERILSRIFTQNELSLVTGCSYKKRVNILASVFAAKEAAVKALGTGFTDAIGTQDVQIIINENNEGKIEFLNTAKSFADELGVKKTHLTYSIEKNIIIAIAILEVKG